MQMRFNQWQLIERGECSEVWLTPKSTRELLFLFFFTMAVWEMGGEAGSMVKEGGRVGT